MNKYNEKTKTPLYTALLEYAAGKPARYHMPGHKGRALYGGVWGELTALDVTELAQTGDLYREKDGPIREAERLLAKTYNAEDAVFLTDGATQGIFAMLAANTSPGDTILIDRLCHQSVIHAAALLDLRPRYIYRKLRDGIALPVEIGDMPPLDGVKAVVVTSPTYNGVLSDLGAIHGLCAENGAKLLIDAAHGAHLPFLPGLRDYYRYDAVVMSAHKTLPALGQAAFLLTNGGGAFSLRNAATLTGTSSPSYPIMASLDLARAFLDERGYEQGEMLSGAVSRYSLDNVFTGCAIDPLRITAKVDTARLGNIVPEMQAGGAATFIISLYDGEEDVGRLFRAITELKSGTFGGEISRMTAAKSVMTPRQAVLESEKTAVALKDAAGRAAAEPLTPYPPGIPVVMPGEIIETVHTALLRDTEQVTVVANM